MFKKELNINSKESTEVMVSDHTSDTQRNIAMKAGGNNKKNQKNPNKNPQVWFPKLKTNLKEYQSSPASSPSGSPRWKDSIAFLLFTPGQVIFLLHLV